ncbi:hypothetical protein GCM10010211_00780 [Streptomyces albospinus]|uniref:Uncharacterized protein n=1 Tax=Streptomyces albospinus TaxID=285515 RepID=A0ABQ2UK46_9ACTN|nr:hypothetical protein [Streptomyces albospinus]GGU41631.1 hypothetical protein GCM10010211_00780 [Streptomyces albospinus]
MNTEPCVECGDVPELLDEDLTCGECRIRIHLGATVMKKTVKFTVEEITHGEVEVEIDVPEEFLDEDGEVSDDDALRDWLEDNENEWYELELVFCEIQSKEVVEVVNTY